MADTDPAPADEREGDLSPRACAGMPVLRMAARAFRRSTTIGPSWHRPSLKAAQLTNGLSLFGNCVGGS